MQGPQVRCFCDIGPENDVFMGGAQGRVPHVEARQGDRDRDQRCGQAIKVGFDGGQVTHGEGLFEGDVGRQMRRQEASAKASMGIERPLPQDVMGCLINKESEGNAHRVSLASFVTPSLKGQEFHQHIGRAHCHQGTCPWLRHTLSRTPGGS